MATCETCYKRKQCIERGDMDAISGTTDTSFCGSRIDDVFVKRLNWFVKQYTNALSKNEQFYVYRICPKCNDRHSGSCEHCDWNSVISTYGCTTFGLWNNGHYGPDKCTIVKKAVKWNNIPTLVRHYLKHVFLSEEAAKSYLLAEQDRRNSDV